jgi:hypothetical protein
MAIPVLQTVHGPSQISSQPIDLTRISVAIRSDLSDQFIQVPAGDAVGIGAMKSAGAAAAFTAVIQIPYLFLQFGKIQRPNLFRAAFFHGVLPVGKTPFPAHQRPIAQPHLVARLAYDSEKVVFAFSIMATACWIRSFFFRPVAAGLGKLQSISTSFRAILWFSRSICRLASWSCFSSH